MTEIDTIQPAAMPVALPTSTPPARLEHWVGELGHAYRLAQSLCKTAFCPASYRNKPEEAAVSILAGSVWGLNPLAAMQAFDVIQGTAAPRAITLRAIAQSAGHRVWIVESTPTRCVARGLRAEPGAVEQESTWTIERAQALQLTGKDNWKKQPQAMLIARATAEVCRLIAADALLGIAYSAEEMQDSADIHVSQAPAARRTAAELVAAPAPAPVVDMATGEVDPDPVDPAEWEASQGLAAEA